MPKAMSGNTSDYRGTSTGTSTSTQPMTFSTVASQQAVPKFPKQDQAILFPFIDGIKLQEYVVALGPIVQPKNILFSSRISNNRICIYLSSTEAVNSFLKNCGQIKIKENIIDARRLITPASRLILSNVCPAIPHEIIQTHLVNLGMKLLSPISFLRVGIQEPQYSHVLSFRRQVYYSPTDNMPIPESFLIKFEGTSYRIFLSKDGLNCYKCKKSGHLAASCPETIPDENIIIEPSQQQRIEQPIETTPSEEATIEPNSQTEATDNNQYQKRPRSEVSSPSSENPPPSGNQEVNFLEPIPPPQKKKMKPPEPTENPFEYAILPAKKAIEEADPPLILNFTQIARFLEESFGTTNPLDIATEYTKDIQGLLHMLTIIGIYLLCRLVIFL
ncbi:unnamed protein product [Phaedon cochleariae]|uniref:CCHC-type domain-containing protein n=1 Tax=Phaedon cochleariae TaxID=80249 RepID=A0A9P0DMJ1_PHACE|nr:unnamed protein product [Phaedon cochleariae]